MLNPLSQKEFVSHLSPIQNNQQMQIYLNMTTENSIMCLPLIICYNNIIAPCFMFGFEGELLFNVVKIEKGDLDQFNDANIDFDLIKVVLIAKMYNLIIRKHWSEIYNYDATEDLGKYYKENPEKYRKCIDRDLMHSYLLCKHPELL